VKPKVLWVTDAPYRPTGYGRVVDNFIKFNTKYDVHCLGLPHYGNPIDYHGATVWGKGEKDYGEDMLPFLLKKLKPEYIITLCDLAHQSRYSYLPKIKDRGLWHGDWVTYSPVDTLNVMPWMKELVQHSDIKVSLTKYTQKLFKGIGLNTEYVPHGVNPELYKPHSALKRAQLRERNNYKGKFVVFSVGKNQDRKGWDRLIKGFSQFVHENNAKDAVFLMHTDKEGSDVRGKDAGYMINVLADKYEVTDQCYMTDPQLHKLWRQNFTEKQLVDLYNIADVGLYAGAEGFGIPILEQQACGRPVIIGDMCSARELVEGHGKIVPLAGYNEGVNGVETGKVSAEGITKALTEYYKDRKQVEQDGRAAREHAIKYDWKTVMDMWGEILK
jgi:glycosyltransferase involved in cell wall biosynthesis